MATNNSGVGSALASYLLNEIIANGIDIHLVSTAIAYTDTNTEIQAASEAVESVASTGFTVTTPADFTGVATIENDSEIVFDVSAITASTIILEVVLQDQVNLGRFVVNDELADPDIGANDSYTIPAGTILYSLGNPA